MIIWVQPFRLSRTSLTLSKNASLRVAKATTWCWLKSAVPWGYRIPAVLEAIRQLAVDIGREHALFMHLTLVPYMAAAGEVKTKPTQHSVKELLSIGIQPDILVCRSDRAVPANERAKIALFCNVPEKAVISMKDVDSIYKIPGLLKSQGTDDYICKRFSLNCPEANLSEWEQVIYEEANPAGEVTIGMVGKYIELPDAYKSVIEALKHGGLKNRVSVNIKLIDSQDVETRGVEILKDLDAILIRRLRLPWCRRQDRHCAMRVKTIFHTSASARVCRLR